MIGGHCCTLCGRRCRYARDVCTTCRSGVGLPPMVFRRRAWELMELFPREVRASWSAHYVAAGHALYERGVRDDLTSARDSEYRRRNRLRRAQRAAS